MEDGAIPYKDPIGAASRSPILVDTVFLISLRFIFFLVCRKFLLSTLNPTLRDLSNPEQLLPTPATLDAARRTATAAQPSDVDDFDTEDDAQQYLTPASSHPPSPVKPTMSLPGGLRPIRDPFIRRVSDESTSDMPIELSNLNQKLKTVPIQEHRILQLSHGKRTVVKGSKKATKGLSRVARCVMQRFR
jgi:hypothetical protein